jgi:ATP-dependent DNA helicase RecG
MTGAKTKKGLDTGPVVSHEPKKQKGLCDPMPSKPPFLQTPLQFLKGIGPALGKVLAGQGLHTFWDLLVCVPQSYDLCSQEILDLGTWVAIDVVIQGPATRAQRSKMWTVPCSQAPLPTEQSHAQPHAFGQPRGFQTQPHPSIQQSGQPSGHPNGQQSGQQSGHHKVPIELAFFQRPKMPFIAGQRWHLRGLGQRSHAGQRFIHPDILVLGPSPLPSLWIPRYGASALLSPMRMTRWVQAILKIWPNNLDEPAPLKPDWPNWRQSFSTAHMPTTAKDTSPEALWRLRLAGDEIMAHHLATARMRALTQHPSPICQPKCDPTSDMVAAFGHSLTPSQQHAWDAIRQDLTKPQSMMRLVYGDVGSGKSVLAFLALSWAAASGHQACLMAPTDTLIRQHYQNLITLVPPDQVQMVLGGRIRIGPKTAPIILGTHALFYDAASFDQLALVVIDEQHKFGVLQRLALAQKGRHPHMLCLSATPIPRTLQRMLWGDIQVSTLARRPGTQPPATYIIAWQKIDSITQWIASCLAKDQRVFWVCPSIEDEIDGVLARAVFWNERFPGKVACLHGRLKSQEKVAIVERFRQGEVGLLITTTVIEVGIDVPQAAGIFIEESPRFGLAQLHQLRGRVGRGRHPGHCFLLYDGPLSPVARQRLMALKTKSDGLDIAQADFDLRGGGIVMGTSQSGFLDYRFFCPQAHHALIDPSRTLSQTLPMPHSEQLLELFGYQSQDVLQAG